jgi:hypothetical protein
MANVILRRTATTVLKIVMGRPQASPMIAFVATVTARFVQQEVRTVVARVVMARIPSVVAVEMVCAMLGKRLRTAPSFPQYCTIHFHSNN